MSTNKYRRELANLIGILSVQRLGLCTCRHQLVHGHFIISSASETKVTASVTSSLTMAEANTLALVVAVAKNTYTPTW